MTHDYPITFDAPAELAAVRALLTRAEYTEDAVARRLGGQTLYGVPRLADGRKTLAGPVDDAQAALIRLFIDGEPLATARAATLYGEPSLGALLATHLVAPLADDPDTLLATVMLYPTQDLWIASDRQPMREADFASVPRDYVFSAINELTRDFIALVPDAPGGRVVELCSGTGIAALRALRRGAAEAWATDVVPRCVHFIRANAQLNALADRLTVVQSDAWDALDGETFDLVVAHPPYVPALAHAFDFRDAGVDGETVTRRIIEGLGAHVRRGGRCVVRAALSDRRGAPIAQRVRGWLGAASDDFDLVSLEHGEHGPMEAYRNATKGGKDFVDCERWLRQFDALGIERFAVCALELRREAQANGAITERRVGSITPRREVFDWHFRWARFVRDAGDTPVTRLGTQAPRVAPGVRLAVHLRSVTDGSWHTVGAMVESGWPSHAVVKAPALVPTLLELCDGTRDVPALLEALRAAGLVGDDVTVADVAQFVEVLAAAGAIALPACPLPAPPAEILRG